MKFPRTFQNFRHFQKRFKRLKRITDEESDNEERDENLNREVLADQLFVNSDEVNYCVT